MLRKLSIAGALVALCLAGSACTVEGQVHTRAYVAAPGLVLVEPGVYVIADYDRPVFYTSGYYWWYRDGYWLRSYDYTGGWVRVRTVPYSVRRIHRPTAYVHYRAQGRHVYRPPVHHSRRSRPAHVDHRSDRRVERRHHD